MSGWHMSIISYVLRILIVTTLNLNSLITETGGLKPIDSILCMNSIPGIFDSIIPGASDKFSQIKQINKQEIDRISNRIIIRKCMRT